MAHLQEADPVEFIKKLGLSEVDHTPSGTDFNNHLHGVMEVLEAWGVEPGLKLAGLYHSIYGTEGFQGFKLSLDERPVVQKLIGAPAEFTCWLNCVMDRASLDATLDAPAGTRFIYTRPEHGKEKVHLTDQEFTWLITLHLADWLEVVERSAEKADERHGWDVGTAWGYRRKAYCSMAQILGGAALQGYEDTFAREPAHTKHIVQESTPSYDWPSDMPKPVRVTEAIKV